MNKDVGLKLSVAWKSLFQWVFRRKEEKSGFFSEANPKNLLAKVQVFGCWQAGTSFVHRIIN